MLTSFHLHKKSREVCIKARIPPASLAVTGQVTKHATVKWPIVFSISQFCFRFILYTTKELHALNIYLVLIKVIILTIKFFLIKVKIVLACFASNA